MSSNYEINWDEQWRHSPYYAEGKVVVSNDPFIALKPGPGFGDLSHPTTLLTIKMIDKTLHGKIVLDVGAGSGVLSLVAAQFLPKKVYGIEIEPLSIVHAKENVLLNHLEGKVIICEAKDLVIEEEGEIIVVMNMIRTEQQVALKSIEGVLPRVKTMITSRVMESDREKYFEMMKTWGFVPIKWIKKKGWIACLLNRVV